MGRIADLCRGPPEAHDLHAVDAYLSTSNGDTSVGAAGWIEVGVEGSLARCHGALGGLLLNGDSLVYKVDVQGPRDANIVRDVGALTKEELQKHKAAVSVSKFKEIQGLFDLTCFCRFLRSKSRNRVDTRWVVTWKWVDGERVVKSRLTMRGFKDKCLTMETFAGTASRAGQRIVNSEAALDRDLVLFSFDVSQAFAKGLTFEEIARLTGTPLREVEFDLSPEDVDLIRRLPGYADFDPVRETLRMLKPIYGLKDAPRAWRKRLHQVLSEWGAKQLFAEPELYALHQAPAPAARLARDRRLSEEIIQQKVEAENSASHEVTPVPVQEWLADRRAALKCVLSTHVDDLKGAARRHVAEDLLKHLERHFGKCKSEWGSFTHTGIAHEHTPGQVICHQHAYVDALRPMDISHLRGRDDMEMVDDRTHSEYQTLLEEQHGPCLLVQMQLCMFRRCKSERIHRALLTASD